MVTNHDPRQRQAETIQRRLRVYVMARVRDYGATWHDPALDLIQAAFPDAQIVPAKGRWSSSAAWLAEWPELAPTLDAGIMLIGDAGIIGRGVYRESHCLLDAGKSVAAHRAGDGPTYSWIPEPTITTLPTPTLNEYAYVSGKSAELDADWLIERGEIGVSP